VCDAHRYLSLTQRYLSPRVKHEVPGVRTAWLTLATPGDNNAGDSLR
jgi:hypothetical protein